MKELENIKNNSIDNIQKNSLQQKINENMKSYSNDKNKLNELEENYNQILKELRISNKNIEMLNVNVSIFTRKFIYYFLCQFSPENSHIHS